MDCAWIGVGFVYPVSASALRIGAISGRSENCIDTKNNKTIVDYTDFIKNSYGDLTGHIRIDKSLLTKDQK